MVGMLGICALSEGICPKETGGSEGNVNLSMPTDRSPCSNADNQVELVPFGVSVRNDAFTTRADSALRVHPDPVLHSVCLTEKERD
jgi:hypothetical protein